jgi:hypothetical protein
LILCLYFYDGHREKFFVDHFLYFELLGEKLFLGFLQFVPFLHQTLLGEHSFLVRQLDVVLQVLPVLVPKPRWLALFPLALVEDELRLYQLFGGVELAHLPLLALPA